MKTLSTVGALIALCALSTSSAVLAKDWHKKGGVCPASGQDRDGVFVGGAAGRQHLHVGSNFLSIYSDNNKSKVPMGTGKGCRLLDQAILDVPGGGYARPNDVTSCLIAAKDQEGC